MDAAEVREAQVADATEIVAIEEMVSLLTYPNALYNLTPADILGIGFGEERVKKYQRRFFNSPDGNLWVATVAGEIVGFAAATKEADKNWLSKLYVLQDFQSKGVGSQLLQAALDWLGNERPVWLSAAEYDVNAKKFYEQHGFKEVGPRPEQETIIPSGKILPETLMVKH